MSTYLDRVAEQTETDARDADVTANVVVCGGAPSQALSTHVALGAKAGVWRWCVLCRLLDWLVQRGHCELVLAPDYVAPRWVYVRAGVAFLAATLAGVAAARWVALALAAAILGGCGAQQARQARNWAPGRTLGDLESCMGVPAHVDERQGLAIAEWDYQEPPTTETIPLADLALLPVTLPISLATAGSITLARAGSCHAIATAQDGTVTGLRYSGDSDGLSGRDAVCAVIVRGCVRP
jgi:hypothetical protein